jgi:hypothetical protein
VREPRHVSERDMDASDQHCRALVPYRASQNRRFLSFLRWLDYEGADKAGHAVASIVSAYEPFDAANEIHLAVDDQLAVDVGCTGSLLNRYSDLSLSPSLRKTSWKRVTRFLLSLDRRDGRERTGRRKSLLVTASGTPLGHAAQRGGDSRLACREHPVGQ